MDNYLKPLAAYAGAFLLVHSIAFADRVQNINEPAIFGLVVYITLHASIYGRLLFCFGTLPVSQITFYLKLFGKIAQMLRWSLVVRETLLHQRQIHWL